MWKFIVRRVFLAIVIVVLGSFIIYGVMRAMPTSFVEAMARQPEMRGTLTTTMFMGCAVAETTGLYSLIIALILIAFSNEIYHFIRSVSKLRSGKENDN